MSLRKSTSAQRTHTWTDTAINFRADASKHDGEWFAESGTSFATFTEYQPLVDWVMDKYRLTKMGLDSWDGPAAALAGNDGKDWEYLSEDEQRGYIDSARMNARMGV